jgi:hypothetical protein
VKKGNVIHHNDSSAVTIVIQQNTEEIAAAALQKPSKRRRTLLIEEEKKWEEMQRSLENGVLEWKKSLDLGYEFDHLEVWPHDIAEEENQVTLPSNHLSTSAMYALKNLKNITYNLYIDSYTNLYTFCFFLNRKAFYLTVPRKTNILLGDANPMYLFKIG